MIPREAVWQAVRIRIFGIAIGLIGFGIIVGAWLGQIGMCP